MSRTAAAQFIGPIICFCFFFLRTTDAACSSACLNNALDLTAPICNVTTGECLYGCKTGYAGFQCQIPCEENCLNCSARCTEVCSGGCNGNQEPPCHQNGTCKEGCISNFWGPYCVACNETCVENRSQKIAKCNETDGRCMFGCERGHYGFYCENRCSTNCRENSTSDLLTCDQKDGTCTFGCNDKRFYGPKCNYRCNNVCDGCHGDGTCRNCRYDLAGPQCRRSCSAGCVDNKDQDVPRCHQNGTCKEGCETNFWGPTCIQCNGNCAGDKSTHEHLCRQNDGFCVQGCKAGKYGMHCSDDCPDNCKGNFCNRTNGKCINKCSKGFYGEYCYISCSPNCLNQGDICFSENGTCIAETCATSWFGLRCQNRCSVHCVNNTCDRNSGICSDGCTAGHFGNTCEANCPNGTYGLNCAADCSRGCVNAICNQYNGKCECTKSFIGARCDTKVKVYTEATPSNALAINLSSIAGIVLLGTVIMIIVTVYKCRKDINCFKPKETGVCEHTYEKNAIQVSTYNRMFHAETAQTTTNDCIVMENVYDEIQEEGAQADKTLSTNSIAIRVSKNSDRVTVHDLYEDLQRNSLTNDHHYTEVSELSGSRLYKPQAT